MNDEEKKLRRQQEQASAIAARKALDQGDAALALSLLKEMTEFWPQNLITLMSVIGFHSENDRLVKRAYPLFHKQLGLCTNPKCLIQSAIWLRHPSRARSIPTQLRSAIDGHYRKLEPSWNGVWEDPGVGGTNKALVILKKSPEEVSDVNDCLVVASQTSDWKPWIQRYYSLGGSPEDPAYLKLMVAKAVPTSEKPTWRTKGLLKKFTTMGTIAEVRSFLRGITTTRKGMDGRTPNAELAQYALYLYCECERLEHTIEDWVHIAESTLHFNRHTLARMTQRILCEIERTSSADEVFDRLVERYGPIRVTPSARDDIGIRPNPIWQSLYHRIPVDMNAKRIISRYSRQVTKDV